MFTFCDCKHSTTSIDRSFLAQLPVKIRERFPFIFEKSIGVHESIVQLLMSLCTKSVLFSSICSGVNEVHRIKHSKSMLNYLDNIHEIVENEKILFPNKEFIPDFFSSYLDKDKHCGITLKQALLKRLFVNYIKQKEAHMQSSFQLRHDHGHAGDHTQKCSKQITSSNRPDKLHAASYTIVSMLGKVSSSRLTFTKSNDELSPMLHGLSSIRQNMGIPELKRYETDNAAGDGNLWKSHFPELEKDVIEPAFADKSLGCASISDNDFIYMSILSALNNWCMSIITDINKDTVTCVGIDCEWNYKDSTDEITRLLQLSFPSEKLRLSILAK